MVRRRTKRYAKRLRFFRSGFTGIEENYEQESYGGLQRWCAGYHHHLFRAVQQINGRVLWANLHLLFWLSLIPFVTGWMGENKFAPLPVALYGTVLLFAAIAYFILTRSLLSIHESDSVLATALGRDFKGKISVVIYILAIPLAFVSAWIAGGLYVTVAVIWLIPDRRIERNLS